MSVISLFASYLVNAIWQVTVVAAAGWLASRFLRQLGPRAEHIGWVSTLVVAVLAPSAPLFRSLGAILAGQPKTVAHPALIFADVPDRVPAHIGLYQWPIPAIWIAAALYFTATFYFAGRMTWSFFRVQAIIAGAKPQALTAEQKEIWSRCRRLFVLGGAHLLRSVDISGPVVAGVRKPILIVPAKFAASCAGCDLLAALAHECAHAERCDFLKNLCYEAISMALAFHPAIWFIKTHIAKTREMICDSMVAERVLEPHSYAHSLLRLAAMIGAAAPRTASVHAIGIFDANILEKRVMMIGSKRRSAGRFVRSGLTISAALLLACTGVLAAAKAIVIEPQSTPAADQSGKPSESSAPYGPVYRVGNGVSAPVPTLTPDAEFPPSAKGLKKPFSAIVLLKLIVDKDGMPRDVQVAHSYNPDFDREAIKAAQKYRFKPGMKHGSPVAVAVKIEVNFKLY
jgi:TonB family protein